MSRARWTNINQVNSLKNILYIRNTFYIENENTDLLKTYSFSGFKSHGVGARNPNTCICMKLIEHLSNAVHIILPTAACPYIIQVCSSQHRMFLEYAKNTSVPFMGIRASLLWRLIPYYHLFPIIIRKKKKWTHLSIRRCYQPRGDNLYFLYQCIIGTAVPSSRFSQNERKNIQDFNIVMKITMINKLV